jgi:O-acetyl-ADP-ribose deacetylase (regulator of RNase III)
MKIINQDILEIEEGIICHQVNCQGVMGSGLALAIKNKWPQVYEDYSLVVQCYKKTSVSLLGHVDISGINENLYVANLFGQDNYGKGLQTNYVALSIALTKVYLRACSLNTRVYIPYKIGCGLGGGDWKRVTDIIELAAPNAIVCKYE